jgi:hypothetical protein
VDHFSDLGVEIDAEMKRSIASSATKPEGDHRGIRIQRESNTVV